MVVCTHLAQELETLEVVVASGACPGQRRDLVRPFGIKPLLDVFHKELLEALVSTDLSQIACVVVFLPR